MTPGGPGRGLQIRGGLTAQRFDSSLPACRSSLPAAPLVARHAQAGISSWHAVASSRLLHHTLYRQHTNCRWSRDLGGEAAALGYVLRPQPSMHAAFRVILRTLPRDLNNHSFQLSGAMVQVQTVQLGERTRMALLGPANCGVRGNGMSGGWSKHPARSPCCPALLLLFRTTTSC